MEVIPRINALLNFISFCFLISGFIAIKNKNKILHKYFMLCAFLSSVFFLICYLFYHYNYEHSVMIVSDWRKTLYLFILIPHIILATLMLPFIILALLYAYKDLFPKHKFVVRFAFPMWVYVSITGVMIYLYVYEIFPDKFKRKSQLNIIIKK